MTEAQIQAFTSKQVSDYFKGDNKRAISQIIICESGLRDVSHNFGMQHSKQSLNRIDDDDSNKPKIGEDYSEYSKSSKAHVNYSQTSCEGVFHFRTEEYVWVRRSDGSISFGQVMNEQAWNRRLYFWIFTQLYQFTLVKAALFHQWVLPKAKSLYQLARAKAELLYRRVKYDLFPLSKKVSCQTITEWMRNYFISAFGRFSLLSQELGKHEINWILTRKSTCAGFILAITLTALIVKIVIEKKIEEDKLPQEQNWRSLVLQKSMKKIFMGVSSLINNRKHPSYVKAQ
eukprot:798349_1